MGYRCGTGTVEVGSNDLPSTDDTCVASFDTFGNLKWSTTVQVGNYPFLIATGACGLFVATTSPTVDLGSAPLVTAANTIGLAAFGL